MAAIPLDLLDRIRTLERQVRELSGRAQMRPAMNQVLRGDVSIGEGGSFTVTAPDTKAQIFGVGYWDAREYGLLIRRQDGTRALSVRNGNDDGKSQPLRLFDSRNNEIWADDVDTGGIAAPYMALLPPQTVDMALWPHTEETSFTTIARSFNSIWHPKIHLFLSAGLGADTQGEIQVRVNGQEWGPLWRVTKSWQSYEHIDFIGTPPGEIVEITIQARRTKGTGSVCALPTMLFGRQT
ncbi:hypothetical protein ACFU99_14715 [Streptomyces sp. NPDC057654]|uniref:hypothetical protein n=1 Tax=Streptomyces sp. NPDC057654 TaxID=3346196 RepID=UPI00369E6FD3